MKKRYLIILTILLMPFIGLAQSDQHYTMFMYNKLLYNPGYTGSREETSFNAQYRDQWSGIPGSPKTINFSFDAPVGSYMKPFRKIAVGFSLSNEKQGIENNTHIRGYYAYRMKLPKTVLSMGLMAGGSFYSAAYNNLHPYQQHDQNLLNDIRSSFLPNVGAGVYWSGSNFYLGLSVPSMIENSYDRKYGTRTARQVRGYYLSGGYVYQLNEVIKLEPQVLARYAGNNDYTLPFNCDFNISAIAHDRLMVGITYRTDKSLAGVVHLQASHRLNIGYSYDYLMSDIAPYARGAHELVVGYNIVHETRKFTTPRFSKPF